MGQDRSRSGRHGYNAGLSLSVGAMQEQILQAFQRNANDEAVALASRWVQEAPGQVAPLSWLATAQRQVGDVEAALASVDQALALAPEDAGLHLQRATLLLTGRRFDDAGQALARTTELNPNAFEAYLIQAHMAIAHRDFDKARSLSRTAARLAEGHPQLLAIDGMIALEEGHNEQALALLNEAARLQPNDPRVLYALGFAFMANGHLAFAEQAFLRVLDAQPDMLPLMALVIELGLRQGKPDEAAAMLDKVLQHPDGNNLAMRMLSAEVHLQAGKPREAVDLALAVLAAQPEDQRALQAALRGWERLNAVEEAQTTLDGLIEERPQAHALWLARLAVEVVGSEEAVAVCERWLAAMPEHLPALETRMRLHDMRKEPEAAEAVARRIIAIDPSRGSGQVRLVDALLQRDPDAAVAHVQQIISDAGDQAHAGLRSWLAAVQDRAGKYNDAVSTWLSVRQEEAPQRLPLPPQAKSPASWPEMGTVAEGNTVRPMLVWGMPGSGVERVLAAMGAASGVVRTDRYSDAPPRDAFQRLDTLASLADDSLTAEQLVQGWRDALPARGIHDGNVIDWLVWWDNALLWALRPQLPEGRLLVVLRDPRDMLLEWLAFGGPQPFGMNAIGACTDWMVRALEQIARLMEQSLYPAMVMRIDGAEHDPKAMANLVGSAFGMETFPVLEALPPPRLPAGHWRKYRDVLGAAFNNLTPVAVRLGYPEN